MVAGLLVLWVTERAYVVAWIGAVAALAKARGLVDTTVSYGIGPAAAVVGRLRVGAVPVGGWVARDDEAAFPASLLILPHLAIGLLAGWAAGLEALEPLGVWMAGLCGFGEVRLGLFHGLGRAAHAAAAAPIPVALALWAGLGGSNAVLGAVQSATTRLGWVGLPAFVVVHLGLLVLLLRALTLDWTD